MDDLEIIKRYQKEITLLTFSYCLLLWDLETYMPEDGADSRGEQMALLMKIGHDILTSEELFHALENLKDRNLEGEDGIMVKRLYHDVMRERKLPSEFVRELGKTTSTAFTAWQKAREENNFKLFEPHLKKIVELKRKQAEYIGLPGHPYNSLLDEYEEGMTVEELKPKFAEIKSGIMELLRKIESSESYKNQKKVLLKKEFSRQNQVDLALDVAKRMGLKKEFFRMDFSTHPFTIRNGDGDVRITTDIRKNNPFFSFGSTMHEAGHALYEADLPDKYRFTVLKDVPSLGIHESQSRFWEIMVGHSKPFWNFYFPMFDERINLGDSLQWYKEVNFVEPSLIRIESDEVHYPLHIILRFEIEMGLIDGTIKVEDLPSVWNEKMKDLIGIVPENDKEGVLQDVHWSQGNIGYFPTYTLGSIYAVQIYNAMKRELPDIENDMEMGNFDRIREWLKENIHKYGRTLLTKEIIKKACGEELNPKEYLDYLNKKYSEIYNV